VRFYVVIESKFPSCFILVLFIIYLRTQKLEVSDDTFHTVFSQQPPLFTILPLIITDILFTVKILV